MSSATLNELQKFAASAAGHPVTFGIGVGISNGILAEARNLPFTTRSAVITALVIAAGEAALAAEMPNHARPLLETAGFSALGTLIGLWPFVGNEGQKSLVQQVTGRPALSPA